MTEHNLKIWPEYFGPVANGEKTFEVRLNDRDYKVGDVLDLHEWCPKESRYTGNTCKRTVTYVLKDSHLLNSGVAVLGLQALDRIAALEGENVELRKDAERYRWLRHGDNDELVIKRGPVADDYVYLLRREKLDESIDYWVNAGSAALKETP